jgi:type I restriction enzyme M protein
MLTNVDENGKHIEMPLKKNKDGEMVEAKSIKLTPLKITVDSDNDPIEINEFDITAFDKEKFNNLLDSFENEVKPMVKKPPTGMM